MPIPNVPISELKSETVEFFKEKGIEAKRLDEKSRKDSPEQLLNNLKLIEKGYLKRAAILLFHPDPEKFVTGAYIKIGFFRSESDLQFQDTIHGNLFEQVEKTIETLNPRANYFESRKIFPKFFLRIFWETRG